MSSIPYRGGSARLPRPPSAAAAARLPTTRLPILPPLPQQRPALLRPSARPPHPCPPRLRGGGHAHAAESGTEPATASEATSVSSPAPPLRRRAPPTPDPDQSAFSNAVVSTALVWAGAALFGVDPWATARVEPLAASLATGAALGLPYAAALAAVRAALGGVWWAEVEGHGVLGTLPALRAATFAAGVAWGDAVVWRGLALAAARAWVEAPAGAPGAGAAAAAAAAAAATTTASAAPPGADPLALWAAGAAAVDAAAAAAAASPLADAMGSPLIPPAPLPAAWLAPFIALGVGGAAAALACYEPPGEYSVDDRAGDPTAPPVTLRELAWAFWSEEEEKGEGGAGTGTDGGGASSSAPSSSSSIAAGLAARLTGWKAAANEVDAAAAKAAASQPRRPGGFWENLLVPDEEEEGAGSGDGDGDGDGDGEEWLATALGLTAGASVPRWPRTAGPLRAWVVPALVTLEGAALAWEGLATRSFTAPLVTQAVGLMALWAVERAVAARGGRGGDGDAAAAVPPGTDRCEDVPLSDVAAVLAGKAGVDRLMASRAQKEEAGTTPDE